jgi:sulfur-oxidizing protein SoxY
MHHSRRQFLQSSGGIVAALLACGFLHTADALALEWDKAAFDAKKLSDLIKALGGEGAKESTEITIIAPDIAENGAVVPVHVVSKLDRTQNIAFVIEKNPNLLAAHFSIPEGTLPDIQTRVKMAQTCDVYALVKAQGKFYYATKEIKITLGGCGG